MKSAGRRKTRGKARKKEPRASSLNIKKVVEALVIILVLAGIFQMLRPVRADRYYRTGRTAVDAIFKRKIDPRGNIALLGRAVHDLQAGMRLAPTNGEIRACLGDMLFFAGMYREAMENYRTALNYHRSPSLYTNLGVAYAKLNMLDEAEEALETTLAFDPTHKDARRALDVIRSLPGRRKTDADKNRDKK